MHPSMYERDMDHILSIQNSRKGESFPLPGYQTCMARVLTSMVTQPAARGMSVPLDLTVAE